MPTLESVSYTHLPGQTANSLLAPDRALKYAVSFSGLVDNCLTSPFGNASM